MSNASEKYSEVIEELGNPVKILEGLSVSHIADLLHRSRSTGMLRPYSASARLCGQVVTVRVPMGDHLMVQKALDLAKPGQVIVVNAHGHLQAAMVGEILTRYAQSRGIAGFVIDGGIRDLDYISTQTFPVFARGVSPSGPTRKARGEINVPVQVGGMLVAPGDIICGDTDGLVSVASQEARKIAQQVEALQLKEKAAIAAIEAGTLDRTWIEEALRTAEN